MRRECPTPYKRTFRNMGEALSVRQDMLRRNKKGKTKRKVESPYRCCCGGVHFTSAPRPKRPRFEYEGER
ncbi:hypothetical protein J4U01_gp098 [Mycobacterium phage Kumao]|uniref:Uncharacterized protein n=1 Tax=Mycobacterium phage Kumao TaxID=2041344 RepID=A0A2D1GPY0_9CAUD|nr:hypothetical protein J4U01_gp098 [Mycobacterium phage Kumao]ATN94060.1 hypothetical protein SEA_KUMAO_98 [Mycobacterium phage Kumao]